MGSLPAARLFLTCGLAALLLFPAAAARDPDHESNDPEPGDADSVPDPIETAKQLIELLPVDVGHQCVELGLPYFLQQFQCQH